MQGSGGFDFIRPFDLAIEQWRQGYRLLLNVHNNFGESHVVVDQMRMLLTKEGGGGMRANCDNLLIELLLLWEH